MAILTLDDARKDISGIDPGDRVAFQDKQGSVRIGTVRLKAVRCGKPNCRKCPHKIYAYAQYRVGKKVREKYIGVARLKFPYSGNPRSHFSFKGRKTTTR